MLIIQICVGSACHIRGSAEIVELFEKNIEKYGLQDDTVLAGSLCIGKCNRIGVTVQVNDDVHVGVTTENFRDFFKKNILDVIDSERT
jgi:NADH:ubiquinone oxidoreductase subunit E